MILAEGPRSSDLIVLTMVFRIILSVSIAQVSSCDFNAILRSPFEEMDPQRQHDLIAEAQDKFPTAHGQKKYRRKTEQRWMLCFFTTVDFRCKWRNKTQPLQKTLLKLTVILVSTNKIFDSVLVSIFTRAKRHLPERHRSFEIEIEKIKDPQKRQTFERKM